MKPKRLHPSLAALPALALFCSPLTATADSLLAYYEFEDNFDDASGNGNTAIVLENPLEVTFAAGFRGQGVDINDPTIDPSSGGSVGIPVDVDPSVQPEVTFGGWVKVETSEFDGFMATDNGGWDRGITVTDNQGGLGFGVASGGAPASAGTVVPGSWQYVVATFSRSANESVVYVGDDIEATQTTVTAATVDAAVAPAEPNIEIGRYNNQDLDAVVDDAFVIDDALDAHAVNAIRNLRLNSTLDYSPLEVVDLLNLFDAGQPGPVAGKVWVPTTGLDATNPGAVSDAGADGFAVVLNDDGEGMVGGIEDFNPTDSDMDGMEDLWEEAFFGDTSRDGTLDFDMDNLSDRDEFDEDTNPTLDDTDGDGLLDGDEVNGSNPDNVVTDPLDADSDDDNLSDGDEVAGNNPGNFTSNPSLIDTDSDTFSDDVEVAALTDPRDPLDFPVPPPGGLLGYYEFEDDFLDSSGDGNTAVPTQNPNEVTFAPGFRGQGADINDPDAGANTGGSINLPINANPDQLPEVSFGGWVNVETFEFDGFMAIDNGGWDRGITVNASNSSGYGIASGAAPANVGVINPGSWQYVVGTFNLPLGEAILYVGDDVEATQTTETATTADAGVSPGELEIEIGRYDNQDLDGIVDDIFVFGRALSNHEANAIRNLRLSQLDYSPFNAAELFELFLADTSGVINGVSWSPVGGLDATNPGEVVSQGSSFTVVLADDGSGMSSGPAVSFAITRIEQVGQTIELDFNSRNGRPYLVDVSIDLQTWIEADDGVVGTGTTTTWIDTDQVRLEQPRLFYRIAVP